MKKVCHITTAHNRYDVRIFEKECTSLAGNGYDVTLLVTDNREDEERNSVHIRSAHRDVNGRFQRMFVATRIVYKMAIEVDADAYHFHDPEFIPYGIKLIRRGKKVVFDSHENFIEAISDKHYIPSFFRGIVQKIYKKYQWGCCKKFSAIVSVDPEICAMYESMNDKVYMVANFPIYVELSEKLHCEEKVIAFAGGVSEQWNHKTIMSAIRDLPGVRYDMCGAVEGEYLRELQKNADRNQLNYLGKIPHKDAIEMLQKASIGMALCSYSKNTNGTKGTWGNTKLFEMMMLGLPIICTDFEIWKEMIEEYPFGICVNPYDQEAIREAIVRLLASTPLRAKMGNEGKRAIREKYNWGECEKVLQKMYCDLFKNEEIVS